MRQGVAAFVPAVEIAGDPDLLCIWGPHGKVGPRHPLVLEPMGPQLMVQAVVVAFVKEVEVVIGQERDVMPHRDRGGLGLGLGLFFYHRLIFIHLDGYCKNLLLRYGRTLSIVRRSAIHGYEDFLKQTDHISNIFA